jgi:hypothetical protein
MYLLFYFCYVLLCCSSFWKVEGPEDMKNFHSAGFKILEDSGLLRYDTVLSGVTHPTTQ